MKPLLLGHQSEKIKELWNKVKDKQGFLKRFDITEGDIYYYMNRAKYETPTYHHIVLSLLSQIKAESPIKEIQPPRYQFLKPTKQCQDSL
jgi:hypothetical protein